MRRSRSERPQMVQPPRRKRVWAEENTWANTTHQSVTALLATWYPSAQRRSLSLRARHIRSLPEVKQEGLRSDLPVPQGWNIGQVKPPFTRLSRERSLLDWSCLWEREWPEGDLGPWVVQSWLLWNKRWWRRGVVQEQSTADPAQRSLGCWSY